MENTFLVFALGMTVGSMLSTWAIWSLYQKEKQELQELYLIAQGYDNLKKMMKGKK